LPVITEHFRLSDGPRDDPGAVVAVTGRQDYEDAAARILRRAEDLGQLLATWQVRPRTGPDAHARRCANDAVDAVDAMLADLNCIRQHVSRQDPGLGGLAFVWPDQLSVAPGSVQVSSSRVRA